MSWYDDFGYTPYVSVAEKKERNAKMAAKLAKTHANLAPIVLKGSKIASTFWGKAWCDNVESYQDYENRLPRGRSYIRTGAVLDLQITPGHVEALVAGSSNTPYKVTLDIKPLAKAKWAALKAKCIGKISSLLALVQGKLPPEIIKEFCNRDSGLFPSPKEIKTNCSCPDWARLCKHLAAVLYGVGARLDENPHFFFTLRGIDENELIGTEVVSTLTDEVNAEIASSDLANVFGIEFDELPEIEPKKNKRKLPVKTTPVAKKVKKVQTKTEPSPSTHNIKPAVSTASQLNDNLKKITARAEEKAKQILSRPPRKYWTAEEVRKFRNRLNLTQVEFSNLCSTTQNTISRWEQGKNEISEYYQTILRNLENTTPVPSESKARPVKKAIAPIVKKAWTAAKVSRLREKLNLSQIQFGKRLGVSGTTVANWENKKTSIKKDYFKKLDKLSR